MDNKEQQSLQIKKMHDCLRGLAVAELLEVTRFTGICRDSRIKVTRRGNKVTIADDKFGTLATVEVEDDKQLSCARIVDISPTSLLTEDEIASLLDSAGEYSLPVTTSVEVFTRNQPRLNEAVKSALGYKKPQFNVSAKEAMDLLEKTGSNSVRMLTVLPTALDDISNKHGADLPVNYRNFLKDTPIGADKIVRALRLIWRIIDIEEEDLLERAAKGNLSAIISNGCLKDKLKESRKNYDAARKIVGKMCITGAFYPVITMKAARIYSDIFFRPSFR